jgi:hypothetical protein
MLVVGRLEALGVRVVDMINNRGGGAKEEEEEDYWFTPKKVLAYCLIVGLISGTLSFFIDGLGLHSIAAFIFASITICIGLKRNFINGKREEKGRDILK